MKSVLSIIIAGLLVFTFGKCSDGQNIPGQANSETGLSENNLSEISDSDLSDTEISSLQWMREEEMLAHDVYTVLSEHYSVPVFRNIAKSEIVHTNAVAGLLEQFGLEDPAVDHELGKFAYPEIQELYDLLIYQGGSSYEGAIRAGLMIEDLDIADLQKAIAEEVRNEDIVFVYKNLLRGSENHMKAFWFHASNNSIEWEPEHISKERFNEIIGTENP